MLAGEERAITLKRHTPHDEGHMALSRAAQIVPYVKGPWVLDVGCAGHVPEPHSPSWLHGVLRSRFPHVVGIDIEETNVGKLRALGYQDIYLQSAENFSLPQKFNTIVAGEVIEHLASPGLFLERVKAHLAPGGSVIITTPFPFSLLYALYAFLKFPRTCQNLEHTCWFCPRTFEALAQRVGFRIVQRKLIEDYRLDAPDLPYRAFVTLIIALRWVIPERLRCNTMLFILEMAG
jgi:2-polyprenyl-3-methyl-5-hydroxy-6-metoxy-1,4-benzoquinol methylase